MVICFFLASQHNGDLERDYTITTRHSTTYTPYCTPSPPKPDHYSARPPPPPPPPLPLPPTAPYQESVTFFIYRGLSRWRYCRPALFYRHCKNSITSHHSSRRQGGDLFSLQTGGQGRGARYFPTLFFSFTYSNA